MTRDRRPRGLPRSKHKPRRSGRCSPKREETTVLRPPGRVCGFCTIRRRYKPRWKVESGRVRGRVRAHDAHTTPNTGRILALARQQTFLKKRTTRYNRRYDKPTGPRRALRLREYPHSCLVGRTSGMRDVTLTWVWIQSIRQAPRSQAGLASEHAPTRLPTSSSAPHGRTRHHSSEQPRSRPRAPSTLPRLRRAYLLPPPRTRRLLPLLFSTVLA